MAKLVGFPDPFINANVMKFGEISWIMAQVSFRNVHYIQENP